MIPTTSFEAGDQAIRRAEHQSNQRGAESNRDRNTGAIKHAGEKITTQAVGAHPMGPARRFKQTFLFQPANGVRRNPWSKHRRKQHDGDEGRAHAEDSICRSEFGLIFAVHESTLLLSTDARVDIAVE